ncbi:hypothetical protein [Acetobacterium tundrae]|uniref:Uncharacterized protein n=1 Tax=Acetobacterium tundrae TaxID=132932 RepID=A0ABR6WRE2_9FIRM|nr:hypothetical protein [Acetobacterium tundrae]MBC3798672.1 hypothetical protein [Acetobacterium tundrae]
MKNQVSEASNYYWLKTIREDLLVQVSTLAITGCTEFAEIKAKPMETKSGGETVPVQSDN